MRMLLGLCDKNRHHDQINRGILIHSHDLWHFGGILCIEDLLAIKTRHPLSDVFSKLKSLELEHFSVALMEERLNR